VANGYGLTEAGTASRSTSEALSRGHGRETAAGMEVRIVNPDADGIAKCCAQQTSWRLLNEPEMTAEAIVDGWLMTGDMGRFDAAALAAFCRKKNMIVTEEGKTFTPRT